MRPATVVSLPSSLPSSLALSLSLSLSLSLLAVTGCTSGTAPQGTSSSAATSSAESASFCDSYCTKRSTCDSSVDVERCKATCQDETSASVKRLRADVVTDAQACFESSDCRQVLSDKRLGECIDEAAVSIAPSPSVKSFCDAYVKVADRCDSPTERASCLEDVKTYSDSTLAQAESCLDNSCSQVPSCVKAVLGLE